jgi:hypothetical protein
MRAKKRVHDLEYDLRELEVENKQLKLELNCAKKKYRHSSKEDIRNYNEWTFDEATLANKINDFSRDFMFLCYKFLKRDGRTTNQVMKRACPILWGERWLIHTKIGGF